MAEMPIGAAVRRLSEEQPDQPALTCEGVTVLWRDLEPRTNRLAHTLARRGVGQGDFVTIGLPNGIAFYETCIAAWKLGATPQPVSWRLPEREREEIVALVQPAIVVTSPIEPDADASDEPILPDRIAPAFKAPTSGGSTGPPEDHRVGPGRHHRSRHSVLARRAGAGPDASSSPARCTTTARSSSRCRACSAAGTSW